MFCTHTRSIPCLRRPYVFFAFFPRLFRVFFLSPPIYFRLCDANRTVAFRPPARKRTEFPVSSHAIRRVVARYLPVSTFPPTAVIVRLRYGSVRLFWGKKKYTHFDIGLVIECISVRNVPSRYLCFFQLRLHVLAFRSRRRSFGRTSGDYARAFYQSRPNTRIGYCLCRFRRRLGDCFRTNVASVTNIVKYDTLRFIAFLRYEKKKIFFFFNVVVVKKINATHKEI